MTPSGGTLRVNPRHLRISVPSASAGRRLDHFLSDAIPDESRSRLQALIRAGCVRADGRSVVRPGEKLRGGEVIEVELAPRPPLRAEPEDIPLDILYEDDDLIAVNKPAGMVVHAGAGSGKGTLVNALLHRFGQLSSVGGAVRPGIIHRLDKATSGVILAAKNDIAHRRLASQFSRREVQKVYLAMVHGTMKSKTGRIRLPVARDRVRRTRMTTRRTDGRAADTEYRVLEARNDLSLLEVRIHTGRTHQIRVHLSSLGRPVVGDALYGAPKSNRRGNQTLPALGRNFLHASKLGIKLPGSGAPLEIHAPLPPELCNWLDQFGFTFSG